MLGAVFAFAASTTDLATTNPAAVAMGLRATFAVATVLIVIALGLALGSPPPPARR